MNILVTGAAGFIGKAVAHALLDQGHRVIGLDNFNEYYPPLLKVARHQTLLRRAGYSGHEADIFDYPRLLDVMKSERVELVCHLAAQAGVRYSLTQPFAYQQANLAGFLNILECCRHLSIPRLVYASSSSVYGGNKKLPFSETDDVSQPVSLYAATKRSNELMAYTYSHLYKFQTIGLRFFTVYGPWGRPDMAYWLFTEALMAGEPIKVFNHGRMQRDFTYISDVVNGVLAALFADGLDRYEIFNVGNHRPENLMDFIQEIARNLGVTPEMELLPMQPGDVPATYADIERAQRKLGFEPHTPMADGLAAFVHWFQEHKDLTRAVREQREGLPLQR